MKAVELLRPLLGGHIILVAEFRGGKLETVGYVDKKSGESINRLMLSLAVERQGQELVAYVLLQRYFPDTATPEETEIKLEKGRLYAFSLDAIETRRGILVGRLAIEQPVEIDKEEGAGAPAAGGRAAP
jgi:uracil-DNA glycosylase